MRVLKGFSFFEVIIYLALFSLLSTTLLTFSWDVLSLVDKQENEEAVFSDARFINEKLNALIRNASGIDTLSSILDQDQGKLVLSQVDSSETITVELSEGQIRLTRSPSDSVALHSTASKVESLTFKKYGNSEDNSEYIDYILVISTPKMPTETPVRYQVSTTVQSGAFIRNSGFSL